MSKRPTRRRGIAAVTLMEIKKYVDARRMERELQQAIDDGIAAAALDAQVEFFGRANQVTH